MVTQALVKRQANITGKSIHRLYSPCYLVIYMNMEASISPYSFAVNKGQGTLLTEWRGQAVANLRQFDSEILTVVSPALTAD